MKKQKPFRKRFAAITLTALCIVMVSFLTGLYKCSPRAGQIYDALFSGSTQHMSDFLIIPFSKNGADDSHLHSHIPSRAHAAATKQAEQLSSQKAREPHTSAVPEPRSALPSVPWYQKWPTPPVQKGAKTYLLLGVDSRAGERARSDTILVATVPADGGPVRLLSIPRDTYTHIAGHGYTKINHAMSYGGVSLMKQTVEHFLQVPVDHTVVIDFAGFRQMVDELGGLPITVPKDMDYDDPADGTHIHLRQGQELRNGQEVLDYARFRHDAEADTGRMKRQRQVIRAMMQKGTQPANWGRMLRMLDIVGDHVQTDVQPSDTVRLLLNYSNSGTVPMETLHLAGTNRISPNDQLWYFYVNEADRQKISRQLQELRRGNA